MLDFGAFWCMIFRIPKSKFGARTVETENKIVTYFLGWICSNFMRVTFTIYRRIRVNLDIEGAETKL